MLEFRQKDSESNLFPGKYVSFRWFFLFFYFYFCSVFFWNNIRKHFLNLTLYNFSYENN
jgi:hypothetical protein